MDTQRNQNDATVGRDATSGKVTFDDRGNAVWETRRGRRLDHPSLSLMDEEIVTPGRATPANTKAGRVGYDPYQSGIVKKKATERPRKKDLRALSRWIQAQRALSEG